MNSGNTWPKKGANEVLKRLKEAGKGGTVNETGSALSPGGPLGTRSSWTRLGPSPLAGCSVKYGWATMRLGQNLLSGKIWPSIYCRNENKVAVFWSQIIFHIGTIFGECLNYKSGLRILIWPLEVPFFLVRKWPLLPKVPIFETKKMALWVAISKF